MAPCSGSPVELNLDNKALTIKFGEIAWPAQQASDFQPVF